MAPEPIDTIALLQSNIPEDATVLIRVGTTSATADANYGPYPFRASANVPGRPGYHGLFRLPAAVRSEEHTSELQSLMRISYAVFCLKKKTYTNSKNTKTYIKKTQLQTYTPRSKKIINS